MKKKTLVLGASPKSYRYSNMAARQLLNANHAVYLLGFRKAMVDDEPIETEWPSNQDIDTITMYLSAKNQMPYYQSILGSGARRIIFNPGAENEELAKLAHEKGMKTENACTLVLLSTNQY